MPGMNVFVVIFFVFGVAGFAIWTEHVQMVTSGRAVQ